MEKMSVNEKPRCRVSFDSGVGVSSPPRDSRIREFTDQIEENERDSTEDSSPGEVSRRRILTESDDVNPSPSSSTSISDEQNNWDLDSYVLVGNQRRRMSNTVNALDLELFRQRRNSRGKRASVASISNITPRIATGYSYFGPLMSTDSVTSVVGPDGELSFVEYEMPPIRCTFS